MTCNVSHRFGAVRRARAGEPHFCGIVGELFNFVERLAMANATNVGKAERIGSAIAGTVLLVRAVTRPSLIRWIMAAGGLLLVQRGLTGHCMLYRALGIGAGGRDDDDRRRRAPAVARDPVREASEDRFPASDPPAWTPVSGVGARADR
jgi:hypothetical protein